MMQAVMEQQATAKPFQAFNPSTLVDPDHYKWPIDPELVGCRQRLLSHLISLSKSLDQQRWDIATTMLQRFCNHLTHYLTLGHERASNLENPDIDIYLAIASTTQTAISFSDRYRHSTGRLDQVRPVLEQLALTLETRFELEDDLQAEALAA